MAAQTSPHTGGISRYLEEMIYLLFIHDFVQNVKSGLNKVRALLDEDPARLRLLQITLSRKVIFFEQFPASQRAVDILESARQLLGD